MLEAILGLDNFHNDTLEPGPDGVPDFAGERFIYFGDQANMPYGNYPAMGGEDLLRELIVKDAVFLLGKRYHPEAGVAPRFDKPSVKAIVIACNTATAYGIEDIRAALREWKLDVPVIGVVEAGARAVAERLETSAPSATVGVLATVGTCACNAYPKAIAQAAGRAGKPSPTVFQQGSIGLAGAIEGSSAYLWPVEKSSPRPVSYGGPTEAGSNILGTLSLTGFRDQGGETITLASGEVQLNSVAAHANYDVGMLLKTSASNAPKDRAPMRMVVLGCTHFPLAVKDFAAAFQRAREFRSPDGRRDSASFVAKDIEFINPAEYTAKELFRELARKKLRSQTSKQSAAKPTSQFYFSVPNPAAPGIRLAADGSLNASYKTGRATGRFGNEETVAVPLTQRSLPAGLTNLVASLRLVWSELQQDRPASGPEKSPTSH